MGKIEEDVRLNDGDNEKVILKRDPSKDGNVFGGSYPLYFYYFTTSGSSKLTLEKDPNLNTDMTYYIHGSVSVNPGSHLIMNLDSTKGNGLLRLEGAAMTLSSSTVDINDVNKIFINSSVGIQVNNGSTLNINNVDYLINQSVKDTNQPTISNFESTIYIDADVYNYDKDTSTGGGYFRQTGENAETTIEGSFYNAGFKSDYVIIYEALVEINGGKFTVTGNFENGKNIPNVYDDYYGVGNLLASNGALITVNGNFISDAQGDSSNGLVRYSSTVDLNNANLVVKGKFDVSRTDIYLKVSKI